MKKELRKKVSFSFFKKGKNHENTSMGFGCLGHLVFTAVGYIAEVRHFYLNARCNLSVDRNTKNKREGFFSKYINKKSRL